LICAYAGHSPDEAPTGRKEIVTFFYMYILIEFLAMFLDSGIIPTASVVYPVRSYQMLAYARGLNADYSGSPASTPG
jgi:hypothetical protein